MFFYFLWHKTWFLFWDCNLYEILGLELRRYGFYTCIHDDMDCIQYKGKRYGSLDIGGDVTNVGRQTNKGGQSYSTN